MLGVVLFVCVFLLCCICLLFDISCFWFYRVCRGHVCFLILFCNCLLLFTSLLDLFGVGGHICMFVCVFLIYYLMLCLCCYLLSLCCVVRGEEHFVVSVCFYFVVLHMSVVLYSLCFVLLGVGWGGVYVLCVFDLLLFCYFVYVSHLLHACF